MNLNTALPSIFGRFAEPTGFAGSHLRQAITAASRTPEPKAVATVFEAACLPPELAKSSQALALRIARNLRDRKAGSGRAGLVQNLLQEFALSSQEGVSLMCLAEALLRIPDAGTRDALIRDKISEGQWHAHLGKSPSLFVNAATWCLLITGKLVTTHTESGLTDSLGRLVRLGGEPLIRKGVEIAMRVMGEQFVTGKTIDLALVNAAEHEKEGFRFSFDMLGEAALTAQDAARYQRDYEAAIHAIGKASNGRGIFEGPGISIKLSALHPRYSRAQYDRVMDELYPVLVHLCVLAKRYDIGLNIDAEEADRLEISLDLLERLSFEPQLQFWMGLGFVVQAYQKRCPLVIDFVVDLARRSKRRMMIRLVKGAYWDSEIKRAQQEGHDGYPVYTRKPYTDVSYIACARKLLAAPDAVYPQFATHNAHTLAVIHELADSAKWDPEQYEFQCLHGMGEPLYEQVVGHTDQGKLGRPCRIYAPVGTHETLLAYLVRRLLENGANTSFVNRVTDQSISIEELVRDPIEVIEAYARREGELGLPHPAIPLPRDLYGPNRANARSIDLANEAELAMLAETLRCTALKSVCAAPLLAVNTPEGNLLPVTNPAIGLDCVGGSREATHDEIEQALCSAVEGAKAWRDTLPAERARLLEAAADQIEADMSRLLAILIRESGKTAANAIAEVREAVDFLRYYARQAHQHFNNASHQPLGPVVCISPWNFPLAIFLGQVSAALAAGNVVLAKPAEQTPLIAAEGVRALWAAGLPRASIQLVTGRGAVVGSKLVADSRIQGVVFTGSTEVARILQRTLVGRVTASGRAIPLIAETGGQNAMIVDSSALTEQVVSDVIASAFDSAGQRCSALRVLCVQEDVADRILEMLLGAMDELRVGRPDRLATDVGPVIDQNAKNGIDRHIQTMRAKGRRVYQVTGRGDPYLDMGTFVLPTVIEIDSIADLEYEVFGPVLHFVRYKRNDLDALLAQINGIGYGLTMGLHTRIDETIAKVVSAARVGNLYVNRNMVGAVVGVQPFGGEGLSGTGPKAGGPLYLYRLLSKRPDEMLAHALDRDAALLDRKPEGSLQSLMDWTAEHPGELFQVCTRMAFLSRAEARLDLPGPTGERNVYSLGARAAVLCLAENDTDRLVQLAAVLAVGGRAIWPMQASTLLEQLPLEVQAKVALANDWTSEDVKFDSVLLHGSIEALTQLQQRLCMCGGPIVSVERLAPGEIAVPLERLLTERTLSVNTAAAGGNASLLTIG